jgi:F0F1-type ATP synthase assembly protein I
MTPAGKRESYVARQPEQRSSLAVGFEVASMVTTVGLGFSVPPVLGYALDRWWGSTPVATLIGMLLGLVSGLIQTVRLARHLPGGKKPASGGAEPKSGRSVSSTSTNHDPQPGQHRNKSR